jgi:pimeloyl-ACP methyl ester carboxylesterase
MSKADLSKPRLDYVMCASPAGLHRMAYWEWGDPENDRVLLCVHGLTRTGRDFDTLAARLGSTYRVVCPDIVGRGKSDWLVNPASYVVPQYAADILTLIARLRPARMDWLGTSMGGLIGLALIGSEAMSRALRPDRGAFGLPPDLTVSFEKIVLNDIGPTLSLDGLARIGQYVGKPMQFETFAQAVDYVRAVSPGFGPHSQSQWEDLTRHVVNQQGTHWIKHYDLRMAEPFALQTESAVKASEALLWAAYDSIAVPLLVVRGEQSDLLLADTARQMLARNLHARLFEVAGVGHAPTFQSDDQIDPVEQFLLSDPLSA